MRAIKLRVPALSLPVAVAALSLLLFHGRALAAIPIQHWTQPGGAKVYLVESPSIPMVDVRLEFDAGGRREPAEKAGLAKTKDVATQLDLSRINLLAEAQFKKYLDEHPIGDPEIKAEYDAQIANLPREYHARHILVENKVIADSVIRELKKGADFAKLAKDESKDASSKNGGDLGWFTPDTMVKPFADALVTLEKGKYTEEPVQSQFGWHIIRLDGKRAASPKTYEEAREAILAELRKNYVDQKLDEAVAAIRRDPQTQVNRDAVGALTPKVDTQTLRRAQEAATTAPK